MMRKLCFVVAWGVEWEIAASSGDDYEMWSAAEKLDYLWANLTSDRRSGSFMNPLETLWKIQDPDYLWAMTKTHKDWRDPSHEKATHGMGGHAKAHFEWKQHEYTGMFQQADQCVIRMANAAAPGGISMGAYGPNLAVKCLRDGAESANMQFIWQLDGYAVMPSGAQSTCSYFDAPLSNHNPLRDDIAMPLKDTFVKKFQAIDPGSMLVGVSQMALINQNGTSAKAPRFPFVLVLKPAPGLNKAPCTFDQPLSQLLNLEAAGLGIPGKTLYEVYAVKDAPTTWQETASPEHIGSLVLDSPFTTSWFGDHQLFFRHTFWQAELATLKDLDSARAANWSKYVDDPSNYKHEGANIYWPRLPGGCLGLGSEPMLQSDIAIYA